MAFLRNAAVDGTTRQVVLHPEHYAAAGSGPGYRGMVSSYLRAVCTETDEMFSVNATFVSELAGSSSAGIHLRTEGIDGPNPNEGQS